MFCCLRVFFCLYVSLFVFVCCCLYLFRCLFILVLLFVCVLFVFVCFICVYLYWFCCLYVWCFDCVVYIRLLLFICLCLYVCCCLYMHLCVSVVYVCVIVYICILLFFVCTAVGLIIKIFRVSGLYMEQDLNGNWYLLLVQSRVKIKWKEDTASKTHKKNSNSKTQQR